jgi:hypothetical protein
MVSERRASMLSPEPSSVSAFAATIAVGLWVWVLAASSGPPSSVEGRTAYGPIQSISYEFGSKWMSRYFVQQANNAGERETLAKLQQRALEDTIAQKP